jgi:hypothetical protein
MITNIYNKKAKGPTLMELFTATGKPFWQPEMSDVRTTGDTAHIDSIFKFLPHASTWLHRYPSLLQWSVWTATKNNLLGEKNLSCSFYLYRFRKYVSYGFPIINFCNPGVHYETPCIMILHLVNVGRDCVWLPFEDRTDRLPRNVGKELSLHVV